MLPLKWKIFRVVNYLHIGAVLFFLALFYVYTKNIPLTRSADIFFMGIFLFANALVITNGLLNLLLIEKYYPERAPGKGLRTVSTILLIIVLILLALTAWLIYTGMYEVFIRARAQPIPRDQFNRMVGFLAILGLITLTGFYICWRQVSLRKTIRRNSQLALDRFLADEK